MHVSVIIPTLNEADRIAETVRSTRALGDCQIVVVDGGSSDETFERAGEADICLSGPRGRAKQQNAGAAAASGDVLLFLHADCRLEPGALESMREAMSDARVVGGCFRQKIEAAGATYRLLERGNSWRVKLCKWAYGDQGIFVRRTTFTRLGGFPDVDLMEDLLMMKLLKREGRLTLLDAPIYVSPRRWQQMGVVRQTIRNWAWITLVQCGYPPDRLAKWYPQVR